MKEIQDTYATLAKKYSLPPYDTLEQEAEISTIEEEAFLLREVAKRLRDRLDLFLDILEGVLQPDPAILSEVHECKTFTPRDSEEAFLLFKKVRLLRLAVLESDILATEDAYAKAIKDVMTAIGSVKQELLPYVRKMRDGWNAKSGGSYQGYVG